MVKLTPHDQLIKLANQQFEDIIEHAYWEFIALRSNHVRSERDKFKMALRTAKNKILEENNETNL